MALYLTEEDVQRLLPMDRAMVCVEASLRAQHAGEGINQPRKRILLPQCSLHYMAAALPDENMMGLKIYTVTRNAFRFIVLLYDAETGD
jgi:ornithine cyclodeaminase/alanine dehydrogenase-like protein (mu-crystallin family)